MIWGHLLSTKLGIDRDHTQWLNIDLRFPSFKTQCVCLIAIGAHKLLPIKFLHIKVAKIFNIPCLLGVPPHRWWKMQWHQWKHSLRSSTFGSRDVVFWFQPRWRFGVGVFGISHSFMETNIEWVPNQNNGLLILNKLGPEPLREEGQLSSWEKSSPFRLQARSGELCRKICRSLGL